MKNRVREYFIGRHLRNTDDVFEHARAIMLLQLIIFFFFLFILPLSGELATGLYKALVKHSLDWLMIFSFPFLMRRAKSMDGVINFFFVYTFLSYQSAFMMMNPERIDVVGIAWAMFFLMLSALIQRGTARILYCFFFGWIPIAYVAINIQLKGALTWHWFVQDRAENPPIIILLIPIVLSIYAIWKHTTAIQKAKETIMNQKALIEEKNKNITDSIIYAKRIQQTLLPSDKAIERILNRLQKK